MRRLSLITLVVLLAAACGGRQEVYEVAPGDGAQQRSATLPDPVPAAPVFVLNSKKPLTRSLLKRLSDTPGVAVLAPIAAAEMPVSGPAGRTKLKIGAVQPLEFRSVAPPSTRDADFIWISMVVGQAVPTFAAAKRLGLEGAAEVKISGTSFRVGALADNGTPNIVDVLVQNGAERQLDLGAPRIAVVGARSGVTIQRLGRDLRAAASGISLRRLELSDTAPATQTSKGDAPEPVGYISGGVVGEMRFQILPNGFIRPDPSWVTANIVTATVPILGLVRCHRLMIPRLQAALEAVQRAGLSRLIRPNDYGGCYVPRFIDRDPTRPLSLHAFGLAVDLNVSTNGLGTRGDIDPRIVQMFERVGFIWGGRWARPDPMHFELSS